MPTKLPRIKLPMMPSPIPNLKLLLKRKPMKMKLIRNLPMPKAPSLINHHPSLPNHHQKTPNQAVPTRSPQNPKESWRRTQMNTGSYSARDTQKNGRKCTTCGKWLRVGNGSSGFLTCNSRTKLPNSWPLMDTILLNLSGRPKIFSAKKFE